VYNAYYKLETVEHVAQITFIARELGNTTVLDENQVAKLVALRKNFGVRPDVGGLIPAAGNVIHSTHTTDTLK
jgi:ribulose-5-phosphate 4-epimerase/fuculose-1-phosphate aldolase